MPQQAAMRLTTEGTRRLIRTKDDLQTISQVLYLLGAQLSPDQARLKCLVNMGQSAVRRLGDSVAAMQDAAMDALPPTHLP